MELIIKKPLIVEKTVTYDQLQDNGLKYVVFSVFKTISYENKDEGTDWIVTDERDNIAVHGKCQFKYEIHQFFSEKNAKNFVYVSPVVIDPTWIDIAKLADNMIQQTGDKHHIFLEGIEKQDDGTYEFIMGS